MSIILIALLVLILILITIIPIIIFISSNKNNGIVPKINGRFISNKGDYGEYLVNRSLSQLPLDKYIVLSDVLLNKLLEIKMSDMIPIIVFINGCNLNIHTDNIVVYFNNLIETILRFNDIKFSMKEISKIASNICSSNILDLKLEKLMLTGLDIK